MKKHFGILVLALGVGLVLLMSTILYTVNELQDIVVIRTFGRITAAKQGKAHAGLHFKWPWPIQKVVRYDGRTSVFRDTYSEVATRDKQNMLVTLYCAWRIEDAEKFQRTIEDRDAAQERLRDLLRNYKKDAVGSHDMADFVNTDPEAMKIPQIEQEIFQRVRDEALRSYGIEVVGVGLEGLNLPEQVTAAVIDSMKEERQEQVRRLKSEGEADATDIVARASSARTKILKFAERKAEDIRTEGYLAAAKYYKEYGKDYKLSMFLRALESARKQLKSHSVFLLDGSVQPWVKWLRKEPSLSDLPGDQTPPSAATQPAAGPDRAGPGRLRTQAPAPPAAAAKPAPPAPAGKTDPDNRPVPGAVAP